MVGAKKHLLKNSLKQIDSDQTFEILINNMGDGVLLLDKHGVITMYNAALLEILNTNQTLSGHLVSEVLDLVDDKQKNVDIAKLIRQLKRASTFDNYALAYDELDRVRLEIKVSLIKDDQSAAAEVNVLGYLLLIRDVTKVKNLEEERDEFISVVSHELRTPITVAEGTLSNLDILINRGAEASIIKKFAHLAHDQVLTLASMLNDLSSLARAERKDCEQNEEVDLEAMAKNILDKYTPLAEEQGLRFDLDMRISSKKITTNKLYLEEILQNLIGNAIKYTKEGSVTLQIDQLSSKQIEFAVVDTGIGIPKANQADIFQKFFRVEDYRTRETGGTGLGLYVCQKLATKLGTKINVVSRLNFGSTFSFILKF